MSRNAEFIQPETPRARTGSVGSALSWVSMAREAGAATGLEKSEKHGIQAAFRVTKAEGAIHFRASGKRGPPPTSPWPRFSRSTPHAAGRKLGSFSLLDSAFIRSKSQSANG